MKNYAIILASGLGKRYKNDIPKQFVKIAGKTILEHTINIFEKNKNINYIILVITPEYRHTAEEILLKNNYKKVIKLVNGGKTRKESSYIGISSIEEKEANVIIHDCARPFLSEKILTNCIKALSKYNAIDVAIPCIDTVIKVNNDLIKDIPNREYLMRGKTPQCFKLSLIKKAHELSKNDENFTDDCGLVVKYNLSDVYVIKGDTENIKITYNSDIYMADRLFQLKSTLYTQNNKIKNMKNKVVIIFGGTSGIGQSIKELSESMGAIVFAFSRRTGCDITSYADVQKSLKKVYKQTGKIDFIVNTSGILKMGKLSDREIDDVKNEIDINFLGSINVVKASTEYLKKTKGCILLFTSSSYTRGRALYSIYSSVKAGIVNLTQALAEELYSDNIRINAINPERTATPMRYNAFGKEPKGSLLSAKKVAEISLKVLLSELTGEVVDVRKK